jgi:hypothetical protein
MTKVNREGLTFGEWLDAAGWTTKSDMSDWSELYKQARAAWSAGEDPTDYRADGTFTKGAKS